MASDTPFSAYKSPDQDMKMDQEVRSSTKSLETAASPTEKEKKKKGGCSCCGKCLNCFFCYLPWIPILLCLISLVTAIISLATIQEGARLTRTLMDRLGFTNAGFATKILKAMPLAVRIALIVMAVVVVAIFLLTVLRSNQRAIHRGMYRGACCEHSCCYWGLILPAWIVTAIWWLLVTLVVVLLMALVVWIMAALLVYFASDVVIKQGGSLSNKLNQATVTLVTEVSDFVDKQNQTMQSVLARNPTLLEEWNKATAPLAKWTYTPAGCTDGCLDVSIFGDAFGSKKCICAAAELQPLKDQAQKIYRVLIIGWISSCILYLAASLLLVTLTNGNTNAYRDKEELKRLRQENKAQKAQDTQFIQSEGQV